MKKNILIVLLLALFNSSQFSLDLNTDFLSVDPVAFVEDQTNKIVKGRIISQINEYYYGMSINCTMSAQKSDPGTFLIFYEAPAGKNEEFYSFFKDYLKLYLDKAFCTCVSASLTNDEIESDYFVYIEGKMPVVIYSKYSPSIGIRGFGITYENYKNGVAVKNEEFFINAAFYGEKKTTICESLNISELDYNYAYLNNCDIKSSIEWRPCQEDKKYGNTFSKRFVVYNDQNTSGNDYIVIELSCNNPELLGDPSFLSSYFEISNGWIITMKEIIDCGNQYIIRGATDVVGIRYYFASSDKIADVFEKNAIITISSESTN